MTKAFLDLDPAYVPAVRALTSFEKSDIRLALRYFTKVADHTARLELQLPICRMGLSSQGDKPALVFTSASVMPHTPMVVLTYQRIGTSWLPDSMVTFPFELEAAMLDHYRAIIEIAAMARDELLMPKNLSDMVIGDDMNHRLASLVKPPFSIGFNNRTGRMVISLPHFG